MCGWGCYVSKQDLHCHPDQQSPFCASCTPAAPPWWGPGHPQWGLRLPLVLSVQCSRASSGISVPGDAARAHPSSEPRGLPLQGTRPVDPERELACWGLAGPWYHKSGGGDGTSKLHTLSSRPEDRVYMEPGHQDPPSFADDDTPEISGTTGLCDLPWAPPAPPTTTFHPGPQLPGQHLCTNQRPGDLSLGDVMGRAQGSCSPNSAPKSPTA